jgi:hypothetical protein
MQSISQARQQTMKTNQWYGVSNFNVAQPVGVAFVIGEPCRWDSQDIRRNGKGDSPAIG